MKIKIFFCTKILILYFFAFFIFAGSLYSKLASFEEFKHPNFRVFMLANQDYVEKDLDLRYAINDIVVFKKIFQNVFGTKEENISFHTNQNLSSFLKSTKEFTKKIQKNDTIVIIYTGHGNINGMPIFTDKKTITPKRFHSFINSFDNDTILIMDSCYSGAEGTKSSILNADNVDNATASIPPIPTGKEIKEVKGYKSNILRIYSSLAHQQSREARYKKVKKLQKHLGKTYSFLESIGYNEDGNGIFSIIFASFFAEISLSHANYNYDSLSSYLNLKVSSLKADGFANQRPKITPFRSPFKNTANYYLLYKDLETKQQTKEELTEIEKKYIKGVIEQSKRNYNVAIDLYEEVKEDDKNYKDVEARISECYEELAYTYKDKDLSKYIDLLTKAYFYNPQSFSSLNSLAHAYSSLRNYDKAIEFFNKSLRIAKSNNIDFLIGSANNNIGFIYYNKGKLTKALGYFDAALKVSKKIQDLQGQTIASNYIGAVYLKQQKIDKALNSFRETKKISKLSGNKLGLASALNNIALIQVSKRNYDKALNAFGEVVSIFKSEGKTRELITSQNNIAFIYKKLGKYKKALEYYNASLNFYKKQNNKIDTINTLIAISDIYSTQKNYKKALGILTNLDKIIDESDVKNTVNILIAKAAVYIENDKYTNAENLLVKAKQLSKANAEEEGIINASIELSIVYESLIKKKIDTLDYNGAILYLNKVLSLYQGLGYFSSEVSKTYANIGYVYYKQELYDKALVFFRKTISSSTKKDIASIKKLALGYIANVLFVLGVNLAKDEEYEKAFVKFEEALKIRRGLLDHTNAASTALTIASLYEKINLPNKAIKYYIIALDLFLNTKDLIQIAKTYHRLGVYYSKNKEIEKAYEQLSQAFGYIDGYEQKPLYKLIKRDLVYSTNLFALSFYKRNIYKLAAIYYMEAINLIGNNKSREYKTVLIDILKGLSLSYLNSKQVQKAILYQKKLIAYLKRIRSSKVKIEQNNLNIILRGLNK